MKQGLMMKNTAILTATSFLLRFIGMVFKIWLTGAVGSEGIGLYSLVTSVYFLAAAFASDGLAAAVVQSVSSRPHLSRREAERILKAASLLTLMAAGLFGGLIFGGSRLIATYLIADGRIVVCLKVLCLALPFKGLAACLKGYYYARRQTLQPALSQIFEQLVRIAVIMAAVSFCPQGNLVWLTAAIALGDAVSEAASYFYMLFFFKKASRLLPSEPTSEKRHLRELLKTALPIAGSRYLSTGLHTAESLMVPTAVALYLGNRSTAVSQFGMLKGMALPILFFPAAFLSAISTVSLPEFSEAKGEGNTLRIRLATERVIRGTVLFSLPVAGFFFVCAKEIGLLLFHSEEVGFMLRLLAPLVPFMYLEGAIDGIVKGLGQQGRAFWYNTVDSILRITAVFFLVPYGGMTAFIGIMIISNLFTSLTHTARIVKVSGAKLDYVNYILKPLFALILACALSFFRFPCRDYLFLCLTRGGILTVVYAVFLVLFGSVRIRVVLPVFKKKKPTSSRLG